MLELLTKGTSTPAHPTPLLFVHGGWHGAWCWADNFLDYFAGQGFLAAAVSLRGHAGSASAKPLKSCTVADYVDDVAAAATELGASPVVVGHSMGGFVVQKYLEKYRAPAGVLMASMPSRSAHRLAVALRIMRRHPAVSFRAYSVGTVADLVNTPQRAREHFFCDSTPESVVADCAQRLQAESHHGGGLRMRFTPGLVTSPLLVLGAEHDRAVSVRAVHATARDYGTTAEIFTGMGHNMMLEPGWPLVAERIQTWLAGLGI
ncbi:pimeloyl-ACP methyl ester carboxylesterase [Mycolicibacterium sp. BK634]|uniref:alpha/beta hydrolase n=1 Tax=Mycolicibacterium sp. BK634 TaxID=2587099 RepID=UPI0016225480|nr:alpha/beta fold hydrolase [Mycolicibacterium sp. BK634]MBB3749031.1 pimeloyl-ACP methyl ester carboxylesterase [Mycolicibacterium sp. BK634]